MRQASLWFLNLHSRALYCSCAVEIAPSLSTFSLVSLLFLIVEIGHQDWVSSEKEISRPPLIPNIFNVQGDQS